MDETDGPAAASEYDFLVATRIRDELRRRPITGTAPVEPAHGPLDPERELRAAEFLLATRVIHEANERVVHRREPTAPPEPGRS